MTQVRLSLLYAALVLLCVSSCGDGAFLEQTLHSSLGRGSVLWMGQRGKRLRKQKRKDPTKLSDGGVGPQTREDPEAAIHSSPSRLLCQTCSGRGVCTCNVCQGRGKVRASGLTKSNRVELDRVVGSQWSSVQVRMGHRHYRVGDVKGSKKRNNVELRMHNCCGDQDKIFWIPLTELKDKNKWRKGWVSRRLIEEAEGGELLDQAACFRCKGTCVIECLDCNGTGMDTQQ